jgi:hypothetical protein
MREQNTRDVYDGTLLVPAGTNTYYSTTYSSTKRERDDDFDDGRKNFR